VYLRSYERAERVYGAMQLRGYRGSIPAAAPLRFRAADGLVIGMSVSLMLAVRILAR
jgi:energy-coupling factor transporter transmembrane protein EcfT